MLRLMLVAFLGIATYVSGCLNAESPVETEPPAQEVVDYSAFVLSECTGMGARFEAPEQGLQTPVPTGWEGKNGLPTTVTIFAIRCGHVSLGMFERGPIDLVFESHGKFDAPENCREGEYTFLNILTRIVTNDPDFAATITRDLGIPTSVGSLYIEPLGPAQVGTTAFRWTIDQGESVAHLGRVENTPYPVDATYRYAWAAGPNLGMIDMHWQAIEAGWEPIATPATFSPPMILATAATPILVGTGSIVQEFFPSGYFRFYEGLECAVPLQL